MKKNTLKLLCFLLLVCISCGKKEEQAALPPANVTVFVTKAQDVPLYREFVGQVYGFKDIAIRARVEGFLEGIHFDEGSRVEEGALLYTLESQPFQAEEAAQLSRVAQAKTMLAKAESDLNRIRPLAEVNAVSQSDLDSAVAHQEATLEEVNAARANLRAARIQLGYTKIYAPITGVIGKTKAKVGDFVGREPNPVILNAVSRIDTVLVEFFITETDYLKIARHFQETEDGRDRPKKRDATLELILADGSVFEHKGAANFIDRDIDPSTGAMLVQASFPNPDELLRPGLFSKVRARIDVVENGILIPQRCLTELQGLFSVYVVDSDNKAENREVKVGPKIEAFWLITEGLKSGEQVVYEGLQRVRDGAVVNPTVQDIEMPSKEGV